MSVESSLELNIILEQVEKYCSFSMGKEIVRKTVPSFDKLIIQRDHAFMKEALATTVHYGTIPFGGITDIREMLINADKGRVLSGQECLAEIRLIKGIQGIVSFEKTITEVEHTNLKDLIDTLNVHRKTEQYLSRCFNEYGEVVDSASPELRGIRSALRHAESEITSAANKFVASHADQVVDAIVTYRNGRAIVLVKASDKNTFGGMVYGDSASGQASYIEPASFIGPNNRRQELAEKEKEEIHRILVECSKEIREVAKEEIANLDTCAILDAVFAKAQWGKDHDACAAVLSEEKEIYLKKARHPLIDPAKVVANDYHLASPQKVLLITGPNTGGKTVSMKVIGLFVLMTYCGMPVTCEEAVIPYFDHVFADIGDDQSVVSSLSSFSAHISKQAEVANHATAQSLVLLDEVGSGTDPKEGEALAIAVLNELRKRGCMTICTTHYDRLKLYGKRHTDVLLASVQFDLEKLVPTYKYIEGLTGQSNAFEVAEKYGLPDPIIKYARFLKDQAKSEEDILIERLEKQLNDNQKKREDLERLVAENQEISAGLKKQRAGLEKERDEFREKAQEEADEYLEKVHAEADEVLKEIRQRQENGKYHEALEAASRLNTLNEQPQKEEEIPQNISYKVGDAVELRSSSTVCQIIKIEKKDITILINGREMRVKKNQIRPSMRVIPKARPEVSVSVKEQNIFASIPSEVNLIGMHVDEAMEKLDTYMDTVKLHGMKSFRVIHGDGTGKLRKAVHARLSSDTDVKSFRLGMPNEGGTGATVVDLK
jgi:DNA mismatch repair protein MutS2